MEGSGSKEEVKMEGSGSEMEGSGSKEEAKMKVSESAGGNGKTKMVTRRLDKMSIDIILKDHPPFQAFHLHYPQSLHPMHVC